MTWDNYFSTVTHVAIQNSRMAEAHFLPKRAEGSSDGGDLKGADLSDLHKEQLVLIWPHRSQPLPLHEGQKVNLRVTPNGKIVSVAYGLAVDHWRERNGTLEATGIAAIHPPFNRLALAKGRRIILVPDRIQVPLDELRHVWVNFMNETGLQFLGWEGGDIQETELFASQSASENFSFENPSPTTIHNPKVTWTKFRKKEGSPKKQLLQSTERFTDVPEEETTVTKDNTQ